MNTLKKIYLLICILIANLGESKTSGNEMHNGYALKNINSCARSFSFKDSLLSISPCCQFSFSCLSVDATATVIIAYGDGTPNDTVTSPINGKIGWTHSYCNPGIYTPTLTTIYWSSCNFYLGTFTYLTINANCGPPAPCYDCISSFAPIPGKKYLLSAWTKEETPAQSKTSYTYPSIDVLFPFIPGSTSSFFSSGHIIDGWQRIEGEFTIPASATDITIRLNCSTSNCYYDDIRILPFDASMKSYVYDPVNMRLVAELDERNFATLYEYDEEGKLIRVKKETEKGKMTIKENRNNTKK